MNRLISGLCGIAAVLVAGLAAEAADGDLHLREFISHYVTNDKDLQASLMRLEASKDELTDKSYLPYPSLRLDFTSPDRSWYRTYAYRTYLDTLYRGFREYESEYYRLSLTLTQRLPTGGNLSVTGLGRRTTSDFAYGGFPPEVPLERETGDREFLSDVGIALRQPLLGLWERKDEVRKATLKHGKQMAQARLDSARSMKQAINVFFDYLVAAHRSDIGLTRYRQALANAEDAERRFGEELISEMELLEKQVAAGNAEIALFESQASLEQALRQLKDVVPAAPAELVPEDLAAKLPVDTLQAAGHVSPEVIMAGNDVEIARVSLAQTRRRRFGQTTVSLSYGFQGIGDDFAQARSEFDRNRWGGSLSIGLSLPEAGLGSSIDLARADLRVAESNHEEALEAARERAWLLARRMSSLRNGLELQARRIDLMVELVATKQDQYEQQVISLKDKQDLDIDLLEARITYLDTLRKLNIAWVDLMLNRGESPMELLDAGLSPGDSR
jgi:outer membrane protein TolC